MTWASPCGQHRALVQVSENLLDSERLFAFMDAGVVGSRCPPVVTRIGRRVWSAAYLVQLGGLLGDHRQTATRRGRTVGGSVDEWNSRIVS